MDNIITIRKNSDKEIFTVRVNTMYHGIVQSEAEFFIANEGFDSPLKAANHARSMARKLRAENRLVAVEPAVKQKTVPAIRSRVSKKKQLFTEAEVATRTHLRFKEVWVILNIEGRFVMEAIKDKTLVRYCNSHEKALAFNSYEEALRTSTTLDMVVRKGHQLRRYFEKQG